MTDRATAEVVLDAPMGANDAGATTVREYLTQLLVKVWDEEECFDGKRPFGNSGWTADVMDAVARAGFVPYTDKGDWLDYDEETARDLVAAAISALAVSS